MTKDMIQKLSKRFAEGKLERHIEARKS